MRVIAGTARSIPLKAPAGLDTRPTTDKIKETLFNILQFEVQGALIADLFAGSGALGIEALSRGARFALFADSAGAACDTVRDNVRKCHMENRTRIQRTEAAAAIRQIPDLRRALPEDTPLIIFMDPPYGRGLELPVLRALLEQKILEGQDLIVLEEALDFDPEEIIACGYALIREKKYKNQKHLFFRRELS